MNTQLSQPSLWQKLSDFQLDDSPEAAVQFSDKLIKEQKWTPEFAKRAMAEYKKFLYLCLTMPQGASPSEVVDEVWHLHLTYTQSYWQKLCGEVLQRQLHHYPNKGGNSENQRHRDWYAATLITYVKEFQELPPVDCWPLPKGLELEAHLAPTSPFRTPTLQMTSLWEGHKYWPVGAAAIGLCSLGMFMLSGPHFLLTFPLLMAWAWWGTYHKIQYKKRVVREAMQQLHPYHFAALFKDTETLFRTIVADFAERGWIRYQDEGKFGWDTQVQQPMLYALQAQDKKELPAGLLRAFLYPFAKTMSKKAIALRNELAKDVAVSLFQWWVIMVGLARIAQGLLNGKPVIFLLLLLIVYVLVWIVLGQLPLIDNETKRTYQANEWEGYITAGALTFLLFDASYSLGSDQTLQRVFRNAPKSDDGIGWLGGAVALNTSKNSGGGEGGAGCSSGGDGGGGGCGGGCGGCGGCGGS